MCDYLFMLVLKSIHVSKIGPCGGGPLTSDDGVRILMTLGLSETSLLSKGIWPAVFYRLIYYPGNPQVCWGYAKATILIPVLCSTNSFMAIYAPREGSAQLSSRLFHSPLAQPWQQANCLPSGLCKGSVPWSLKTVEISHQSHVHTVRCNIPRIHCNWGIP